MSINRCSYCQKRLIRNLKISEILFFTPKIPQICAECASLFRLLDQERGCRNCQQVMNTVNDHCDDCLEWKKRYPEYDFCHHAKFYYDVAFKEWLKRYKFMGDIRLAGTFAKYWQEAHGIFADYLMCPIPITKERLNERGFNQVTEMLKVAKVPYQQLLKRPKNHLPQAQKTKQERLTSRQPFQLMVDPSIIEKKKILLVDDVYTTGQTLFHAADCLLPYFPGKIRTFSLARTTN
ncbi:amidophosphoribosyltransferase [Enterococcus villorum]|uniref:Amidophosphoribosyltransferase n=1 Tax=Enterococcus villorum TaxID=112904 RepID=A0A1V8YCH3_9ENTE|nr:phosphoribosyltransferase family protein [Enterococcus villorum]OQO70262.1 amidophosphoribosyltransferase [Enterococcus villorum]OQO76991.1 amidophosphoribosyltransferase [Enterococcus villorum]